MKLSSMGQNRFSLKEYHPHLGSLTQIDCQVNGCSASASTGISLVEYFRFFILCLSFHEGAQYFGSQLLSMVKKICENC